jgi:hypothetical protein
MREQARHQDRRNEPNPYAIRLDSTPVASGVADLKEGLHHAKHQCVRRS